MLLLISLMERFILKVCSGGQTQLHPKSLDPGQEEFTHKPQQQSDTIMERERGRMFHVLWREADLNRQGW